MKDVDPKTKDEIRPQDVPENIPEKDRGSREHLENPRDEEDRTDEAIDESFPASDPPSTY